jgi:hypothetical protein
MTKTQGLNAASATTRIHELAASSETEWSFGDYVGSDGNTHALKEMDKDGIDHADALYVLKRGRVTSCEFDTHYLEWRYRVQGRNVDGKKMVFVVCVSESEGKIKIVTAWAP